MDARNVVSLMFSVVIFGFLFYKKPNIPIGRNKYISYQEGKVLWIIVVSILFLSVIYINLR